MAGRRDLRSFAGRALLAANVLAALAAAVFVVLAHVAPGPMSVPAHAEPGVFRLAVRGDEAGLLLPICAVALLLADFLWVVYGSPGVSPVTHVTSETAAGPVRVSRDALEAGLRSAGEAVADVSRVRVGIEVAGPLGKRVVGRAQFFAPDGVSIPDVSQRLRRTLQKRFEEMVRLPDGHRLEWDVEFGGFQGKRSRRPGEDPVESDDEADPELPFTGPRYPIDEDARDG